mmetsp:Transcript_2390/g.4468  ORF Transcript_2390/g.4468 Transcript_2390/m.4468 type:complete len:148 (+) Transcript_2390:894-1337(+)|eukprot:CAMPEP_0175177540 /NCGR_PEP_ID=MMETSP0087-20121206/34453_1 /TAXON_ID=136419 /ORGANISM="Unknown Unknown, Strain D1" /LENGTH=147 /DNA_ID=CAMNT_0016469549 /DNA_START=887 /DNA_END=1330 /DNA_ORIENTATION=-
MDLSQSASIATNDLVFAIVDDVALNRDVLEMILKPRVPPMSSIYHGCDGMEGLNIFKENKSKHTLFFMDIRMPKMNGIEATMKIREDFVRDPTAVLLVIAISASEISQEHQGLFDRVLVKPVSVAQVKQVLVWFSKKVQYWAETNRN